MWSRRKFVISTVAGLSFWAGYGDSFALNLYGKQKRLLSTGKPTLLAGEYWSPAIASNFIGTFGNDLCCIVDEFGRLITTNITPSAMRSHVFPVLGRIDDLGTKVFDLKINAQLAFLLVWNASGKQNKSEGGQFALNIVDLSRPKAPYIVSSNELPVLSEFSALGVSLSTIALTGLNGKGQSMLWLYSWRKGRKFQLQEIASLPIAGTAANLLLDNNRLLVAYDTPTNHVDIVDLSGRISPEIKIIDSAKLHCDDAQLACSGNRFALSAVEETACILKAGQLTNFPHVTTQTRIDGMQSIEAIAFNGNQIMVLGSDNKDRNFVVPFFINKNQKMERAGEAVPLEINIGDDDDMQDKLVLGKKNAFIGLGWDGVQVISSTSRNGWKPTERYSVPKVPIASAIVYNNSLILGGADLRLYNFTRPQQPQLVKICKLPSTINHMTRAGSYALCLDQNSIALRKIDNLSDVIAQIPVSAKTLCFDGATKKAYLVQTHTTDGKKKEYSSKLLEINVYADKLEFSKSFPVINGADCAAASDGFVVVGGLDGIAGYEPDKQKELTCRQQVKNMAWREMVMSEGKTFATAIDHEAKGYFYTMSFDGDEIAILGSIEIPHDGLALSILKNKYAISIGQKSDNSNLMVVIDLNDLASPKIISTQPVLESASSIVCSDDLIIVCGRGFETFRLAA